MKLRLALAVAAALLFATCKDRPAAPTSQVVPVIAGPKAAEPSPAATVDDAAGAKELFAGRCTPCHGPTGGGDGPASAGLTPKPASFNSPEWQKAVTDEHIEKIILYGGLAVGKSAAMPPNPDLGSKPEVVTALREFVRALKR